jgi:hypothetical protein
LELFLTTLNWAVIFTAYGFINVGLTGVANIGMTYVMDSYYPIATEALLLVTRLKNIVAFGYTYGVAPWADGMGYARVYSAPIYLHLYLQLLIFWRFLGLWWVYMSQSEDLHSPYTFSETGSGIDLQLALVGKAEHLKIVIVWKAYKIYIYIYKQRATIVRNQGNKGKTFF